jgi:hypothetical protein
MYLTLEEWLSTAEEKCSYDKHCIAIITPKSFTLQPSVINEICLEGLIGEGYTLQVKHHVNVNKPWRVMNEFIHPQKNCLTFPIITKKLQEIQAGETLFHVQSTSFKDVLSILKGNPIKKINNDILN